MDEPKPEPTLRDEQNGASAKSAPQRRQSSAARNACPPVHYYKGTTASAPRAYFRGTTQNNPPYLCRDWWALLECIQFSSFRSRRLPGTNNRMRELRRITRLIKPMRGGSQAWLVEADDDHCYVAKFLGNPQGNRTLVNEIVATRLLQGLGVCVPQVRLLRFSDSVLGDPRLIFKTSRTRPVENGIHFGSLCPVDPRATATFDFLPSRLLPNVANLADFGVCFAFDAWVGHMALRQAVYFRDRHAKTLVLRSCLIDHGHCFGGWLWNFSAAPGQALVFDRSVYRAIDLPTITERALGRIERLTEEEIDSAASELPEAWFSGRDRNALTELMQALYVRRAKMRRQVEVLVRELSSPSFAC